MPLQLTITGKIVQIDVTQEEKISFLLVEHKKSKFKFLRIVCKTTAISEKMLPFFQVGAVISATGDFFGTSVMQDELEEKTCVTLWHPRIVQLISFAPFKEEKKEEEPKSEEEIMESVIEASELSNFEIPF